MNDNKYPEYIMKYVRQNLDLEKNDISEDEDINNMSKDEVLNRVCNWNGLCGYGTTIRGWIENIYGIKLNEE